MNNRGINTGGDTFDRIFRALGDPHRIQIIELLRERELSAGEILEAIDIVQSTLSHHMKTLSDSGAVDAIRRGKWTYYSLNEENLAAASACLGEYAKGTKVRRKETEERGSGKKPYIEEESAKDTGAGVKSTKNVSAGVKSTKNVSASAKTTKNVNDESKSSKDADADSKSVKNAGTGTKSNGAVTTTSQTDIYSKEEKSAKKKEKEKSKKKGKKNKK